MRNASTWIWLSLAVAVAGRGQNAYYFPVAGDGASGNNTVRTSLLITNPGVHRANVTISWTNDDSSPRQVTLGDLGSDSTFSLAVPPGATRVLQTDGSGGGPSGAATVGSDQVVNVWGVQSVFNGSGSLVSETGIAASASGTGFRIPVDSSTGVALYNPGPNAATISVSLADATGAAIGSQSFILAAGNRVTRFASGDLFDSLAASTATLDVKSTVALAAQTVRTSGAVFEAAPLGSKRMRFYFPHLADGPSITSTLRTTLTMTNLSKNPANVTVTLAREDGSPWTVAIPGMDANSTFQTAIAPGASIVWQTDGAGSYATGAATIRSDAPIGVQALVTAFDAQGTLLSETPVPDARLRQQFTIPFDITTDLISGATLFNPGSREISITASLLDADGQVTATAQVGPIPPGGQTSASITDLFPGTSVVRGSIAVNAGTGFVSAVAVRQSQSLPWPSTLPAGTIPLNGVPLTVVTATDDSHAVSASIGPKGGSLILTDPRGNKFTLTIPPKALLATEKIVMTPITSAKGMPGSGLVSVQLAPDGLALLLPATLAIQPAAGSASSLTPVGWYGASAPGIYLNVPQPGAAQFTMLLTHFSNAGGANLAPGDLTAVLLNIIDLQAFYQAQAAVALKNVTDGTVPQDFIDAIDAEWDQVIEPLIAAALSSQDDNVIQCAIYHALAYERQLQLLALDPDNVIGAAIADFVSNGLHILITHAQTRCTDDHDFTALQDLLSVLRESILVGGNEPAPDYSALESQCPYRLQFDFSSLMLSHYTPGGYFKGQISAKFPLNGTWDKTILTSVTDPDVDLYASYLLSASGQATYDIFQFQTDDDEGCTVVANGLRPGKVTIYPQQPDGKRSQVQFKFTAAYDPAAYSISGVQLCAFCPVFRKKLVKVDVLMDPGLNWEDITNTCPLVGAQQFSDLFWNDSWDTLHPFDPSSGFFFFPNWDLVVSSSVLAQIQSTNLVTAIDRSVVESTVMRLARIP